MPEFQACSTDCDCAAGLSCLPTLAHDGTVWTCLRPCTQQTDCPESGCTLASVTAPWTCGSVDACPYPEDCPAGLSCVIRDSPSFCQDHRQGPIGAPCKCDAECPSGQNLHRAPFVGDVPDPLRRGPRLPSAVHVRVRRRLLVARRVKPEERGCSVPCDSGVR
ncbi:MAG: hypothetical protein QM765_21635 [Myxococcales bacterium]